MDKKEKIKKLLASGVAEEKIEKIISADDSINLKFETVTQGLKTAYDAYNVGDMANLNVAVDNLNSVKKNVGDLEKELKQYQEAMQQPGVNTKPVEEPAEAPAEPTPIVEE